MALQWELDAMFRMRNIFCQFHPIPPETCNTAGMRESKIMGTLCVPKPSDRKAYLDKEYTNQDGSNEVLKSSFVGSTYYAAIKVQRRESHGSCVY
ncbi:hypothetical protein HSBAA_PA_3030 (plasmid) [Vreelandella sulfidaeris]|uniref:Uncharacterized protein n=1 Tax=Vreelandella sulfidaeris TaxID=115553 RepID=A0A455UHJ8_9GAMM|nr:hypothetical protein HSBAA_PA_3030 [Halomonas sulfidaeris]